MTVAALLVAAALLADPVPESPGAAAYREGRWDEAATLLAQEAARQPSYDGLLKLGLAEGRRQRLSEARAAFDRAIALDPARAEAWLERGGLSFLEKQYPQAVPDLQRALERAPDEYTRDLLASALHLAGRSDEALAQWNRLGRPRVGQVELSGLQFTREKLVRGELAFHPGQVLRLSELRQSRLRLNELGIFDRVTVRPVPRSGGSADVQLAAVERHGLFSSPLDAGLSLGVGAIQRQVHLRYSNLGGRGVNLSGRYRFAPNQPELTLGGDWPRPFGWPVVLRLQGSRGEQPYEADGAFRARTRGARVAVRHVLGQRGVLEVGYGIERRSFDVPRPDAPGGLVAGLDLALDARLVDGFRQRLDARLTVARPTPWLGSDLSFGRAEARLAYKVYLAPPQGAPLEPSVLALQLKGGWLSAEAPLDQWLGVGASPEMDWPVRGRRLYREGALGVSTPLAREVGLANLEWRQRVYRGTAIQIGLAAFLDGALLGQTASAGRREYLDAGAGLRLAFRAGPLLRLDFAHGLLDGSDNLSLGLGYIF